MANPSRTSQGKLQDVAQTAGEILPYDRTANNRGINGSHPGWWWRPEQLTGCDCKHCVAARAGRPSYLGFHDRGAMIELVYHQGGHEPLYPQHAHA